jgi:chromosome segregation ATPase
MTKQIQKLERLIEQLFLEMYGHIARFEKLEPEIQALRDKAYQLDSLAKQWEPEDVSKSELLEDAQRSLDKALFNAGSLTEELQNFVDELEDAHASTSDLSKVLELAKDARSNEAKARKSAFSQR